MSNQEHREYHDKAAADAAARAAAQITGEVQYVYFREYSGTWHHTPRQDNSIYTEETVFTPKQTTAKCECGRPGYYTIVLAAEGVVKDQVTFCKVCGESRTVVKSLGELDLTFGKTA